MEKNYDLHGTKKLGFFAINSRKGIYSKPLCKHFYGRGNVFPSVIKMSIFYIFQQLCTSLNIRLQYYKIRSTHSDAGLGFLFFCELDGYSPYLFRFLLVFLSFFFFFGGWGGQRGEKLCIVTIPHIIR